MKRLLSRGTVAAFAITPLLALAACGGGAADGSGDGATRAAAVIKGLDNPFFQTMESGIQAQAQESGIAVEVQAAQSITDTTGQAERLDALAQQDFGCYIVNPITGNNLVQGLAQIAARGVPVVNIDQPIDAEAASAAGLDVSTYIGTDNVEAGTLAGQRMAERLGGTGTVAIIGGLAGDVTSNARVQGFTDAATAGGLTVLPVIAADWDRQRALTTATDLMTANPDLGGIFTANDDMGLGASRAVANAGRTGQIAVISVDGNEDAIRAVQSGELDATVAQYPYTVGQLGVQACAAAESGATLPENVTSPVALVTSDVAQQALDNFPAPFQPFDNPLATAAG